VGLHFFSKIWFKDSDFVCPICGTSCDGNTNSMVFQRSIMQRWCDCGWSDFGKRDSLDEINIESLIQNAKKMHYQRRGFIIKNESP
jgi:hypothetical protein